MKSMPQEMDWLDNHELRISELEIWKQKHDNYTTEKIREAVKAEMTVDQLKDGMKKTEAHLEKQDTKLEKLSATMNKIIIGVLTSIALALAKIVVDLTILRPVGK